jgi:hypothetical protein
MFAAQLSIVAQRPRTLHRVRLDSDGFMSLVHVKFCIPFRLHVQYQHFKLTMHLREKQCWLPIRLRTLPDGYQRHTGRFAHRTTPAPWRSAWPGVPGQNGGAPQPTRFQPILCYRNELLCAELVKEGVAQLLHASHYGIPCTCLQVMQRQA